MDIKSVETHLVRIPYSHDGPPTGFGGKVWTTIDTLLVRLETDTGLVGWGEAFGYNIIPATAAAIETVIAPLVLGEPADRIEALTDSLFRKTHLFGRNGPAIYAISGLELALWDIAGKAANQPVHRLFGGGERTELPAYASLMRYGQPDLVAAACRRAMEAGFRAIKLHEVDPACVRAARRQVGPDVAIMLDTNCPWDLVTARRMAKAMEADDLLWLEEPVWPPEDAAALARLRGRTSIPVAAGENASGPNDLVRLIAAGAVDYAQPSVTKIGGIGAFRAVSTAARQHAVGLAPHSPYFGPGLLATLQILSVEPTEAPVERLHCAMETDLYGGLTRADGGVFKVPQGPGLGLDPDPDVLARHGERLWASEH